MAGYGKKAQETVRIAMGAKVPPGSKKAK